MNKAQPDLFKKNTKNGVSAIDQETADVHSDAGDQDIDELECNIYSSESEGEEEEEECEDEASSYLILLLLCLC